MPLRAHVWLFVGCAIAGGLLVLLVARYGWSPLVFAVVVGAPVFVLERRLGRRMHASSGRG